MCVGIYVFACEVSCEFSIGSERGTVRGESCIKWHGVVTGER